MGSEPADRIKPPDDYPDETCAACGVKGCEYRGFMPSPCYFCAKCLAERNTRPDMTGLDWLREKQGGREP